MLANIREAAFQFGSEISRFSSDLDRLPSGFAPKPAVQFLGRGIDIPPLAGDWHPRLRPPLRHRERLT